MKEKQSFVIVIAQWLTHVRFQMRRRRNYRLNERYAKRRAKHHRKIYGEK